MRLFVLVDAQPRTALTRMFLSLGEVKIPGTQNMRANSDVTEVSMVALEGAFARYVRSASDFDARVTFSGQPITQCQFEIRELVVVEDEIRQSILTSHSNEHSITELSFLSAEELRGRLDDLETWLTNQDDFRDVSRGKPKPHSLDEAKRREVGLTRDTWKLEVVDDPENSTRLRSPLTKENNTAFTFRALMNLAKQHAVRFPKIAIDCSFLQADSKGASV